jgi:dephospho-CoA kinase
MSQKIIIGFTGLMASGKDAAKKYLEEKYGAESFRFSSIMRDVLKRINVEMSRTNLSAVSLCLRQTFGEDLFAKVIANDAQNANSEIVVVDGVRRLADIAHLSKLDGFHLVAIEADPKIRHERLVKRGENVGESEKTYEQFIADHQTETELTIPEVMSKADLRINNDGSFEDLYKQIDELVAQIKNK